MQIYYNAKNMTPNARKELLASFDAVSPYFGDNWKDRTMPTPTRPPRDFGGVSSSPYSPRTPERNLSVVSGAFVVTPRESSSTSMVPAIDIA